MRGFLTKALQMSLKPVQTDDNNGDVDEAKIGDNGDKIEVKLLVSFELLHINAVKLRVNEGKKRMDKGPRTYSGPIRSTRWRRKNRHRLH